MVVLEEEEGEDDVEDGERAQGEVGEDVGGGDLPGHAEVAQSAGLFVGHPEDYNGERLEDDVGGDTEHINHHLKHIVLFLLFFFIIVLIRFPLNDLSYLIVLRLYQQFLIHLLILLRQYSILILLL